MLKLYGFAVSNYFNMVKHTLLLKDIPFEEVTVTTPVATNSDYLAKSPMGKVPSIETEQGFLAETSVILEYLEEAYPQKPLYPSDAWGRAKTRELMKMSELYLELQARRLLPALLTGAPASEETKKEVKETMKKGVRAVSQLASFKPYALGTEQTVADIVLRYSLTPAKMVAETLLDWSFAGDVEGLAEWEAMMAESPISQQLDKAMNEQLAQFMESMRAKA